MKGVETSCCLFYAIDVDVDSVDVDSGVLHTLC